MSNKSKKGPKEKGTMRKSQVISVFMELYSKKINSIGKVKRREMWDEFIKDLKEQGKVALDEVWAYPYFCKG